MTADSDNAASLAGRLETLENVKIEREARGAERFSVF